MNEESLTIARPGLASTQDRGRVLATLGALLFLNGMLSFSNWWPTPGIVPDHRIAPEFVWLWVLMLILARFGINSSPRLLGTLTLAYLFLVLGRYLDVTAPALFGRNINLYWDGAQIPRFLWVAAQEAPFWQSVGMLVVGSALLWVLYRALHWSIDRIIREAVPYAFAHRWVLWITAAVVVLVVANHAGVRATWPAVSKPVMPTYWRQAQLLAAAFSPQRQNRLLPPSTTIETALARGDNALSALRGRDVYLIVLESYGAVVYDHPRAAPVLGPARERFAANLRTGGLAVVSAVLQAPTFGGASDLSHLGLLAGLDLSDPMRHDVLLTSRRPTLNTLFGKHGYETIGFYPSLFWEWPERTFYGYERFVDGPMLEYPGPSLGPWSIPDQYAAERFEQRYTRTASTPPRFVFFPTITSHFPFSPVPPFQPDRERLLGPMPYDAADIQRARAERIDWLDMLPGYLRMIEYTYRWLGDSLRRPATRETIYILVGDHQPTANISGEGATWDVPVHVVARDPALLQRFVQQGFTQGLDPVRAPLGGLHDLTAIMLRAFGSDA